MYIKNIHIQNYRNFNDFTMEFHKGLNVIIGANNSGKTGLLYAVKLLRFPNDISVDDFNKNNLLKYATLYAEDAPRITIEYSISHKIFEDDTNDESIIRLLPFLGMKELSEKRKTENSFAEYGINAHIKAVYSLDVKRLDDYKKAMADVKDFDEYMAVLRRFVMNYYSWCFTNGISETKAEQKEAIGVFDIRFIGAERTSEEVRKETKREIESFTKDSDNAAEFDKFKHDVSKELETLLAPTITKLSNLFENEKNAIGLAKGYVSIASSVRADFSLSDTYITEVKDTKAGYVVPLQHNGLGYNNLINIYMLIKLTEIRKGKDFRILCLEEPEAHLHPAMQYKLFKYLRELDKANDLNQQIFVTTHSSNISAVAGIENMFMMACCRDGECWDCCQQSLSEQFIYKTDDDAEDKAVTEVKTSEKQTAKAHLAKFLDVTRSDMLFADKVILVEGIAEKLLMPAFMSKCGCPYEDEHISIVEIGGKHFEHFVELFNNNNVIKKVLCITDRDFKWIDEDSGQMRKFAEYESEMPQHIEKLKERFPIDNFNICTQKLGGRTFEDEFFLANVDNTDIAKEIFKKAVNDKLGEFLDQYSFSVFNWDKHSDEIDGRSIKCIGYFLDAYKKRTEKQLESEYEKLLFAEIFLHYAKNKKGDIALELLTDEKLNDENGDSKLVVPNYIREGLEWLLK
jgi:putative ATP-dependent endonuclease of OLD family